MWAPKHDTFPGEVLLELAADALEEGGVSRAQPIDYQGIRERYLPEGEFRGRAQHHSSHYALRAVTMIRAGVTPDLLDEVSWWDTNDLWIWSLYALVIDVRVAARHGVELTGVEECSSAVVTCTDSTREPTPETSIWRATSATSSGRWCWPYRWRSGCRSE